MIARMRGFSAGRSSCSGHEGSGIEGEGCKSAVVAEADLRSEKTAAEQDAGDAGIFDNGQIAGRTIEAAGDFPEEGLPDEGRRIAGDAEILHTPANSIESLLRSRRQRMNPVCR